MKFQFKVGIEIGCKTARSRLDQHTQVQKKGGQKLAGCHEGLAKSLFYWDL